MEKTKVLKDILTLLKAAKTSPEQFAQLIKDDMPHPANSPEDKAHDVAEEDESLKQALSLLDTPEKRAKMLEHLMTLSDESQHRSEENQEVGMEKEEHDEKEESEEKEDMEKRCWDGYKPVPGKKAYSKGSCVKKDEDKESEEDSKEKEESKEKKDMSKSEKSPLELAKELLKAAKEAPEQFAELTKSMAPAAAPAPKPAASAKPAMPKVKAPSMKVAGMAKEEDEEHDEKDEKKDDMEKKAKDMSKCGSMKMSKEEIKADLKKEWKPKFKKDC